MNAFSSEASTVHFYRIKMGHIETWKGREMAESGGKWLQSIIFHFIRISLSYCG
jgi:hypothetical protein